MSNNSPKYDAKDPKPNLLQRMASWVWARIIDGVQFIWDVFKTFILTLRAILFMISKTFYVILPSTAHTSMQDDTYNQKLRNQVGKMVDRLDLDETQVEVIKQNWLEQMAWANGRATRERDANELIRWWQIILGVLIPVLINLQIADTAPAWMQAINPSVLASFAGIFVAVLTAVYQFRRPEERWRHYRILSERYQNEIWNFITLAGEVYLPFRETRNHKEAFAKFHDRMMALKEDDVTKFFGEVVAQQAQPQVPVPGQIPPTM